MADESKVFYHRPSGTKVVECSRAVGLDHDIHVPDDCGSRLSQVDLGVESVISYGHRGDCLFDLEVEVIGSDRGLQSGHQYSVASSADRLRDAVLHLCSACMHLDLLVGCTYRICADDRRVCYLCFRPWYFEYRGQVERGSKKVEVGAVHPSGIKFESHVRTCERGAMGGEKFLYLFHVIRRIVAMPRILVGSIL